MKAQNYTYITIEVPVMSHDGTRIKTPRLATVAYKRVASNRIEVGVALHNEDKDRFRVVQGQQIALGRLGRRPITVYTWARTDEGLRTAIARSVTYENVIGARRKS
jgi:hypothetical protein